MKEGETVADKWISKAIKRPGSLRKTAKKAGALSKKGTIEADWLNEQAKRGGKTGQRARLAKTLKKLRGK